MRASPYDLRELGYEPVPIETAEGKARYAAEQRSFAARGQELRGRILEAIEQVMLGERTADRTSVVGR
jgi:hypothetical protein